MKVDKQPLLDFMSQENVRFSIPLFQRSYAWDLLQCQELWRDIVKMSTTQGRHFFGVVIYRDSVDESSPVDELSIIDGQQRIFTTTLLLAALATYLEETGESIYGLSGDELVSSFLRTGDEAKLVPALKDREGFLKTVGPLIEGTRGRGDTSEDAKASPIARNYDFFLEQIRNCHVDLGSIWHGLSSLTLVVIQLGQNDNAQVIFESFNSKGVGLVAADLVRNYLLMPQTAQEQKRLFEDYWDPIQCMFGDDPGSLRLNGAIRAWITIRCKNRKAKSSNESFYVFKSFVEDRFDGSVEDLLKELYNFSMVWAENYRYHAVKKYRTANWATLGSKTLVSDREKVPVDEDVWNYYVQHFGVNSQW